MQNILKNTWVSTIRDRQKEIIDKVIDHRPTLGVMPTGGVNQLLSSTRTLFRWRNNCHESFNLLNERPS